MLRLPATYGILNLYDAPFLMTPYRRRVSSLSLSCIHQADFHQKPAKRTRFLALRSEGMPTLLALRLAQQTNDKLLPRVEVDNGFAGPNNDAAPPK